MEVYIDDMVIKSPSKNQHFEALADVFAVAGKFLGFMLTQRGIESNPEKCEAVINITIGFSGQRNANQPFSNPTILTKLVEGIPILIYLSISNKAISATLVQEFGKEQRPIYFIGKVLQGTETQYQKIEKATLTLIITIRRLRPYF
ncbi:hypothetical protein CR513_43948, partial [Mucuna pruriens]